MSDEEKMSDVGILKEIEMHHRWELKRGILVCLGIRPETYNFDETNLGNTKPQRVYNHCCKLLNKDDDVSLISLKDVPINSGKIMVLRDDLIEFIHHIWPEFIMRTYKIWQAYKAEAGKKKLHIKKRHPNSQRKFTEEKIKGFLLDKFKKEPLFFEKSDNEIRSSVLAFIKDDFGKRTSTRNRYLRETLEYFIPYYRSELEN